MARLTDATGRSLELTPLTYQYAAETVRDRHDLNWLVVRLTVDDSGQRWTATAATLLTWELNELVPWMRIVATGSAAQPSHWGGIEPSIAFEAVRTATETEVRAHLNLDFLPPERRDGRYHAGQDTVLTFHPSEQELSRFAATLEHEMLAFPEREEPPGYRGPP